MSRGGLAFSEVAMECTAARSIDGVVWPLVVAPELVGVAPEVDDVVVIDDDEPLAASRPLNSTKIFGPGAGTMDKASSLLIMSNGSLPNLPKEEL